MKSEPNITAKDITDSFYWRNNTRFTTILPNTYPKGWFEADILAITNAHYFYEYEIKLSVSDFNADAKKSITNGYEKDGDGKWQQLPPKTKHEMLAEGNKNGPSKFWFVMPENMIPKEDIPVFAGLIYVKDYSSDGCVSIRLDETKKAPRLHSQKISESSLDRIRKNLYFRYWKERLKNS